MTAPIEFPSAPYLVFCDFDGTITTRDTIVFLTEKFGAGPRFRKEILERIKSGKVSVFEAIRRELETVTSSWEEALAALDEHIDVDPGFASFVGWCRDNEYPVYVVSSGMEPVIEHFVDDIDIKVFAHAVEPSPEGWRYTKRKQHEKGHLVARAKKRGQIVFVGDGTSDLPVVPYADILFAKSFLAEYCSQRGIEYSPFETFFDVRRKLEELTGRD